MKPLPRLMLLPFGAALFISSPAWAGAEGTTVPLGASTANAVSTSSPTTIQTAYGTASPVSVGGSPAVYQNVYGEGGKIEFGLTRACRGAEFQGNLGVGTTDTGGWTTNNISGYVGLRLPIQGEADHLCKQQAKAVVRQLESETETVLVARCLTFRKEGAFSFDPKILPNLAKTCAAIGFAPPPAMTPQAPAPLP